MTDPYSQFYSLEQAEDEVTYLRQLVDQLTEIHTVNDLSGSTVPNAPTGGYTMFSGSGQQKYLSDDGNAYNTGRLILPATGSLNVNAVTFQAIPGLTCPLGVSTYRLSGQVITSVGVQGASLELEFVASGSLAASAIRVFFDEYVSNAVVTGTEVGALGSAFIGQVSAAVTDHVVKFDGIITVSTAGTITLEAATTVAADNYNVKQVGTYLMVEPIT